MVTTICQFYDLPTADFVDVDSLEAEIIAQEAGIASQVAEVESNDAAIAADLVEMNSNHSSMDIDGTSSKSAYSEITPQLLADDSVAQDTFKCC